MKELDRLPRRHRYKGMSYEAASREAASLIARANETGAWFEMVDRLIVLRAIMQREMAHHEERRRAAITTARPKSGGQIMMPNGMRTC